MRSRSKIRFGPGTQGIAPHTLEPLRSALDGCEAVTAVLSSDIELDLWRKFVMLASFSAVSCMARATIGQVLGDARARALLVAAAEEAAAVGRARGVPLESDVAALVDEHTRDMPREGRPSMFEDLEAGRRLELEFLSGTVVRLGAAQGVPTPIHALALAALGMHVDGRTANAS
ncbi:MAG TPA: ketopantoate reductase C-terminal domain-containing protein [Burkholderiales bacterium]|nr:ketopantoate reductase C-terminal domain-containing protein [Burkholderiales bacterium]